jgi:hypothetical protein
VYINTKEEYVCMIDYRCALFVDFENLYISIKRDYHDEKEDTRTIPHIDFEYLVKSIERSYGPLEPVDFILVANLSRYGQALSGADKYATLINLDDPAAGNSKKQKDTHPSRNYSIKNYACMMLAFEVGKHIEKVPADFYLFVGTDASLAAVARVIRDSHHRQVEFLLPNPEKTTVLKALFHCRPFMDFQPQPGEKASPVAGKVPAASIQTDPTKRLLYLLSSLRREFSTAIPVDLLRALLGPDSSQRLLDRARSEMKIDLWKNDAGIQCVSRYEERVVGKVVKMSTRPALVQAAKILYITTSASEKLQTPISRAEWRKTLKNEGNYSNTEAKYWLEQLFEQGILKDGAYGRLKLTLDDVVIFVKRVVEEALKRNV